MNFWVKLISLWFFIYLFIYKIRVYVEILRGKIYLTKTPRDMIEVNPLFLKKNLDEIDIDVPSISVTF